MTKSKHLPPVPRFTYHGGKGKLARRICSLLPPTGKRFVEPFAGRGNVYFFAAQRLSYQEFWLNDHYTFRFLTALRHSMDDGFQWTVPDRSKIDKGFYALLQKKAQERLKMGKAEWGTTYDRIFRPVTLQQGKMAWAEQQYPPLFVVECYLSYSGGTYKSGMKGRRKNVSMEGFMKEVRLAYEIMQRTKPRITNSDWRDMLPELRRDDVVYFDPPYRGANVSAYSDRTLDHSELVAALLKTWSGFKWVLSEYDDKIYQPLTEKFGEPERIQVRKHMVRTKDKKLPPGEECLWKNF